MAESPASDSTSTVDLADDYVQAGFNQSLGFGTQQAVLIVDMCQAYFTADSPLNLNDRSSYDGCVALVEAARTAGVPIWWSRVEFEPGGNGGVFYRKVGALAAFDRGNPLADWIPGLEPQDGESIITKQGASSFFDTELRAELNAAGVDALFIGGVSTSGCVRASALDACQSNIIPLVVDEACGDRDPEIHRSNLFDLDAKYADVISLDAATEAMKS